MRINCIFLCVIFGLMPVYTFAQQENKSIKNRYNNHGHVLESMSESKHSGVTKNDGNSFAIMPDNKSDNLSDAHADSISFAKEIWTNHDRDNVLIQGLADHQNARLSSHGENYFQGGNFATFGDISFNGALVKEEYLNLLTKNTLTIGVSYTTGNLSLLTGGVISRYFTLGVTNQYGIFGQMEYAISPNLSLTLFGEYDNRTPYFYMATFPYINGSRYGGYLTIKGERVGVKLGAERYYDPFSQHWEMKPIVTPTVHISKNFTLDLPAGDLLKEAADRYIWKKKNGPMIMPGDF